MSSFLTSNAIAGRDLREVRTRIADYLASQDWHVLLGKQRGGEQSLLEHSLAVFDVLCACAPFFESESRPRIEPTEFLGMLLATVAHDAGKAHPDFQAYLHGKVTEPTGHVSEDAIRKVVVGAASAIGFDPGTVLEDIVSEAVLHDRFARKAQPEMNEWAKPHGSPRWRKLADFVNHADSLASAEDIIAAEGFLRRNPLLLGAARATSYQVRVRGVSTTFLHDAAIETFEAAGFQPILFFANGTLFAGLSPASPSAHDVERTLRDKLENLLSSRRERLSELAVGNPLQDFLPKPGYVRRDNAAAVLQAAATRVGRKSRDKLSQEDITKLRTQAAKMESLDGGLTEVDLQALCDIGPEACSFKAVKEIFRKVLDQPEDHERGKAGYDKIFGDGAFDRMLRQSTFMPVNDYALCVRPWHRLEESGRVVGNLDPKERLKGLHARLEAILNDVITQHTGPLPCEELVATWSRHVICDLSMEGVPPPRAAVARELEGYSASKLRGRARKKAFLQCAQCASLIEPDEEESSSASLGNAGSYSNRRLALEPREGSPALCRSCVVDIEVGTLCLGGSIQTAIALVPRRALGAQAAEGLLRRVRALKSTVDRQLSPETADPGRYSALTNPGDALRASALAEAMVRDVREETRKKRGRDLEKVLAERLGVDGLSDLNASCATTFADVAELSKALLDGNASAPVRQDGDVQRAMASVVGGGRIEFAASAPNLIVVALDRPLGAKDEKDVDRALYGFGLAAMFTLELGMACLVAPVSEIRTALASRMGRAVYVPANGPARSILGGDWLGIEAAGRWLRAVRAAVVLRSRAGANSLLEILRYPSAGYAIRRIEQQSDGSKVGPDLWPHIEALKEVLG